MTTTKVKGLCVGTRCTTIDEFIATFYRFCDDDTLFVATLTTRPVGLETPFSILLADRTPALRGLCTVVDAWTSPVNQFRRPGIRIRMLKLTRDGVEVFSRLRARRIEATSDIEKSRPPPRFETAGYEPRSFEDEPNGYDQAGEPAAFARPPNITADLDRAAEIHDTPPPRVETPDSGPVLPPLPPIAAKPALPPIAVTPPELPKPALPPLRPTPKPLSPGAFTPKAIAPLAPLERRVSQGLPTLIEPPEVIACAYEPATVEHVAPVVTKPIESRKPIEGAPKPVPPLPAPRPLEAQVPSPTPVEVAPPPEPPPPVEIALPPEPPPPVEVAIAVEPAPPPPVEVEIPVEVVPPAPVVSARPTRSRIPPIDREKSLASLATMATTPRAETAAEQRTPGSDFVLPANPLMDLSDESLEGFIDCTLYEAAGIYVVDELTPLPGPRPVATNAAQSALLQAVQAPSPVAPYSSYPPAMSPQPTGQMMPLSPTPTGQMMALGPTPTGQMMAFSRPTSGHLVTPMMPAPIVEQPVYAPPHAYDEPAYVIAPPIVMAADATHDPTPRPLLADPTAPSVPYVAIQPARLASSRRPWVIGGVASALVLAVIIPIIATSGSSDAEPPAITNPVAAPPSRPDVAKPKVTEKTALPDEPSTIETIEGDPPPPGGPPVVGKGPCRTTVMVTPAGAAVQVDGATMGPSPLAFDGPCTRRRVDISAPRYATATKFVTPTPEPQTLDVTLARPTHALTVVTVPAGATVLIDGRRAGTSPTVVQIMGYQSTNITTTKAGYKTITKRVYSRSINDRITLLMPSLLFGKKP